MRIRDLFGDRRAVSPVIGVVLMVAITVLLAAVIGTFLLGIGTGGSTPQATFAYEATENPTFPDELRIVHRSGDAIPNDELYVTANVPVQEASGSPGPADRLSWAQLGDGGDNVESGDEVVVEPPNTDPELEDKVFRLVWDDGEQSAVVSDWRGEAT